MRILLLVLSLYICDIAKATTYYVSPTGSDNRTAVQAQNINTPWATWDKCCESNILLPGDTVYIRGGTYFTTKGPAAGAHCYFQNIHGSLGNYVTISAYPGEQPIFDCSNIGEPTALNPALVYTINCSYVHFKGLHVRNLQQICCDQGISRGWDLDTSPNCILEQIECDHIGGGAFHLINSNDVTYLNCDAHHNGDGNSGGGAGAWGGADGFSCTGQDPSTRTTYSGCRSWLNSDDGWDNFKTDGIRTWNNCWSFWNGYRETSPGVRVVAGDGDGFKLGPANPNNTNDIPTTLRFLNNCFSFENGLHGFENNGAPTMQYQLYNCTAYNCLGKGFEFGYQTVYPGLADAFKNNLAYANGDYQLRYCGANTNNTNNSWNGGTSGVGGVCGWTGGMSVTNADFLSVSDVGVDGPRQADGSLPNLSFMKLKPGSSLIDAGVNVGLPYNGTAPDLGAFEYAASSNIPPTANANVDQTITLPVNSVTLSGSGTDPDGTITTYLWAKISGPASGIITNSSSATTIVTGLVQGVYQFQLKVTDNSGATDTDTMQVTVNAATNQAPTANAGSDQNITLPTNNITLSGSGMDPDGTITAYLWTKISGPTSGIITNPSSAITTITGLVLGIYKFELKVTDNNGATGRDTMQVTVNAATNQAPTANAGIDQSITLPINSVLLSGSGTDPDGTIVAYLWTKISGPTSGTITNAASATTTITSLVQGVYQFELKVTDNNGATDTDTMQVTVNAAINQAPNANAGIDQTITLPVNNVTLSGSGTDPDGTITAYLWTKISGPASGTITNATSVTSTVTSLAQGVYQFELRVTDNNGATGRDTMQVTVNAAINQLPTANAGIDQSITLPVNSVTLSGSGTDPDGTIIAYLWTKISGPASSIITNTASAATTVTGLIQGVYQFQLQVTDNNGATGIDIIQVTVNPAVNQSPTANAGLDQNITLPTNSVSLSGSGTDPDGTITAYRWRKIAGPVSFSITSTTSAATTVTGLVQGIYQFELRVTDNNGATGRDTMQVIVNPAVNQLPTANAGLDQNITLPTNSVSFSGSGTDPDGTITAYLWTKISGPVNGTITNSASATASATGLVQGVYEFELMVTDNSGATDTDTMQVIVNPAPNQAPTADAGLNQTITLPTNIVTLSGNGTDPDGIIASYLWTKLSGPAGGTITNPSFSTTSVTGLVQGVYQFQLQVTDNNGDTGTDVMQVNVNAAPPPPNQAPTANAGLDQNITLPTSSISLNGSGTDPDGTITAYLWRKISGPTSGTITSSSSATTFVTGLVQGIYKFELKVTDNSGSTGRDTMQVTVNAAVNQLPTANAGLDQNITLPISSISLNGSGTDPDGTITAYLWTKISGPSSGTITIPSSATTTATGLVQGIYKFELKVTDNNGGADTDTMQVTINPVPNQSPTADAGLNQTITLPTNTVSLNGSGTDPDGTIVSYLWIKLSGPASGTITNPASATTTVIGLVQGVYQFQLRVTDNIGATGTDVMQVNVNAANQVPTANAGLDQNITLPTNSASLNGSGTDPDGSITGYLWTKISGPTSGIINNPASATTSATGLVQGVYKFQLKVTDNSGATDTDTMQVTVNPAVNQPPNANAGLDQNITLPTNSISLNGSGTDPDGIVTAYLWTKISGPISGTINNPVSATTSAIGLVQGVYKFQLKVTDNSGATDTDTMQVTVNPAVNQPPNANAGLDQNITLPTNSVSLNGSGTDPDGTITAYLWTKISGPTSGLINNPASATTTAIGLVQGVYKFQLKVTDNSGATDTDTMQVTVNAAINQAPTANAGLDQNITLPTNSVSLSGSGTDPDGTISAYLWTKISGPANGTITNAISATTSVTGLVQGIYKFELKVTDNSGAIDTDTMQVIVNAAVNQAPTANAGINQNITLPTSTVSLNGSGTDPDGTISAYLWTETSGPTSGTITNAASATTFVTGLVQGIYQFQLQVTDNNGATGTDIMQVTVNAATTPNQAPIAYAGADTSIYLPDNSVILSGNGTDPDGHIVSYSWRIISGSAFLLLNPNNAISNLTDLQQGIYEAELTVTDNSGAMAMDTIMITVGAGRLQVVTDDVKILNNPVQNTLTAQIFSTSSNRLMKVVLFNINGVLLYEKSMKLNQNIQLEEIDMTRYSRGTYILEIYFDKKTPVVRKAIKM